MRNFHKELDRTISKRFIIPPSSISRATPIDSDLKETLNSTKPPEQSKDGKIGCKALS